ncbi:hypothetical protein GCM10010156_29220 [Planobispora rosea]|uniref:GGDEF domain-containing protein n=1 Tax=Planobispora rosea TaxID=35762 RepID=A0A8J3WAN6_PLARO|nr:GGDEF domain-containing protein [Planobispora rosea]GGS68475.1 hypothetical protein GCM10010156_29220 [Planobispora rosea]GIH82007.1 hypothetical protein Pro02_04150 [Planobispora rosea]
MNGSRAWRVYLLGGVAALVVFALLPYGMPRDVMCVLSGLVTVAVMWRSAARRRGDAALPWTLLMLAQVTMAAGDALWVYYEYIAGTDPFPSAADGLYLAQYPIVAAALFMLVRRRRSPGDRDAWLDGAIVVVGLALPYWVLISPGLGGYGSVLAEAIALSYPVGDVLLLAGLAGVLTMTRARTPALRMIVVAVVCLLAGDVIFVLADDPAALALPIDVMPYLLSYLFWGAAALHPSAADLLRTGPEPITPVTTRRLLGLTAVVLLAPGTSVVCFALGLHPRTLAVATASAVLFVLVVTRMAGMLRRLGEQARLLDEIARTDVLTGLPNRRTLDAQLTREYERAAREAAPLALALIDLDRFKRFNDTRGHQAGDALLAGAATAWSLALGGGGMLARYGGEEFVLLIPGRDLDEAEHLLAALRAVTPEQQTFSAGLALWDHRETPLELLRRADTALYAAKEAGRARTVRAEPSHRASPVSG